jgi:WD40 repeat protein
VGRTEYVIEVASALAGVAISPALGAVLAPAGKGMLSWWRGSSGDVHEQVLADSCTAALLAALVRNASAEAAGPVDDEWLGAVAGLVGQAVNERGDTPHAIVRAVVQGRDLSAWGDALRTAIESRLDAPSLDRAVDVEALVRDFPDLLRQLIGEGAMVPDSALAPVWDQLWRNELLAAVQALAVTASQPSVKAPPFMASGLPADFVDRPEQLAELRILVDAAASGGRVALSTALRGTGGFGKTTLAAAVCHAERDRFPDGVLWVTLGEQPSDQQLVEACRDLVLLYDDGCPTFRDARTAGVHLGAVLGDKRVLLVLDDAWRARDLEPFLQGAAGIVRLITTRNDDVLPRGTPAVRVDELTVEQTTALLTWDLDSAQLDWAPLVAATGRWPVLVRLVNAVLRDEVVEHGRDLREAAAELAAALDEAGPTILDTGDVEERHLAVAATVQLSLDRLERRLGPEAVDRYVVLGIFPEDTDVPLEVLATWWRLSDFEVRRFARTLDDLSLLHTYDAAKGTVRLHDVLRGYVRARAGEQQLQSRHARLLDAHRPPSGRWADLPPEAGYLWRWVLWHLHQADALEELLRTLQGLDYLSAKFHHTGSSGLLLDLDLAADHGLPELRAFVRRWIHLLPRVPAAADVAATLLARPDVDPDWFLDSRPTDGLRYAPGWTSPEQRQPALIAVLDGYAGGMAWSPDGARLASASRLDETVRVWDPAGADSPVALTGHDGGVEAVAWSPDGARLASASHDGSVRVWDPAGAAEPAVLTGHADWVRVVAWSPDGARLASAGDDGTVRVWDPAGADSPVVLTGHEGRVVAVAWSPDGARLASAGGLDGTVRVWDPAGADSPAVLIGHEGRVPGVAWSPDGARLASAGDDGTVRVWDPVGADSPVVLTGHDGEVAGVAWSPDGARLASAGSDGTVRVWDPAGADSPVVLTGHAGWVEAVAWSPDGARLASADSYGTVMVRDRSGHHIAAIALNGGVGQVAWSPSQALLVAASDLGLHIMELVERSDEWSADQASHV